MPIDPTGMTDLYQFIRTEWNYIALIDSDGNEHLRVGIDTDSRVNVTDDATDTPLTVTISFSGDNPDVTTPVTFVELQLHRSADSAIPVTTETITGPRTLEARYDLISMTTDITLT